MTDLRPFEHSYFRHFSVVGYGVCVINSFYSFQWMVLKLRRHIINILKMCMWGFNGDRFNFDRITAV